MSPRGALVLALVALVVLGALAAWLVNVPPLAIATLLALSGAVVTAVRRVRRRRARQETEA